MSSPKNTSKELVSKPRAPKAKRRGEKPVMTGFTRWCVDNQLGLSLNLLALLGLTHFFFPKSREYTTKFFAPSHYNPRTGEYGIGQDDSYLVFFYMLVFTGLRSGVMDYVLEPTGKWWGMKKNTISRFCEQGYLVFYYAIFWPLGVYIYCTSDYYMNLHNLWSHWPNREVSGVMKVYMLAQFAFWLQQIIVINIEERRKDHWQMFSHHVVTIVLVYTSWRYGHTRVGNLILILMDGVDIVFSAAKCLKYMGFHTTCDIFFGIFVVSWILARHVTYMVVCYSVWQHTLKIMPNLCFRGTTDKPEGPFPVPTDRGLSYLLDPLISNDGLVCYNSAVQWSFLTFLLFLQGILLVWLFAIFRVAAKVLSGAKAEDSRESDAESEDEEDVKGKAVALEDAMASHGGKVARADEPIEEEVGVEELDLRNWERRSGVRRQASSSTTGVSLPGHSDRKELLGRIGCEKQVD